MVNEIIIKLQLPLYEGKPRSIFQFAFKTCHRSIPAFLFIHQAQVSSIRSVNMITLYNKDIL